MVPVEHGARVGGESIKVKWRTIRRGEMSSWPWSDRYPQITSGKRSLAMSHLHKEASRKANSIRLSFVKMMMIELAPDSLLPWLIGIDQQRHIGLWYGVRAR